jgi:uncharacterized protein DUF2760
VTAEPGCINRGVTPIPWWSRIGLAFVAFFRVLFDGRFAALLKAQASGAEPQAPAVPVAAPRPTSNGSDVELASAMEAGAVLVLGLLQSEGRFIDFLQQELTGFEDAEIGAVARVVHRGCGKVLHDYLHVEAIRAESEGQRVQLAPGFDSSLVKLTGNLGGGQNVEGVLRHKGWRAADVRLPKLTDRRGAYVLAPAEIEL